MSSMTVAEIRALVDQGRLVIPEGCTAECYDYAGIIGGDHFGARDCGGNDYFVALKPLPAAAEGERA